MLQEIERKFLVISDRLPKLPKGRKITQAYFSEKPEIRIRIENKIASLTIKQSKSLVSRDEFEYRIPIKDAEYLLSKAQLRIKKTRAALKLNSLVWQIDFYEGENKGLIVAEIELPKEDYAFKKPLWVGKEITYDFRYRNRSLAKHPYKDWQ